MSSGSRGRHFRRHRQQSGFTYLVALLLVAVAGAGLLAITEIASHVRQREKEAELLWIGNQFKQAIGLYYQRSPGVVKRYPDKLDDLLEDRRYLSMQRYLRRIYPDPMTGKSEWTIISAPTGGIMGVRSQSTAKSIRTVDGANEYQDWKFVYEPPAPQANPLAKSPGQ